MLLYWIPNLTEAPKTDKLAELGLGYVFDRMPMVTPLGVGPDGNSGHIATFNPNPRYIAENQTWLELVDNQNGVWVGKFNQQELGPGDFARDEQLEGEVVNGWQIPRAVEFLDIDGVPFSRCGLPTHLKYAGNGQWYPGDVQARYSDLWTLATNYQEQLTKAILEGEQRPDGMVSYTRPNQFHAVAVSAIQTNYKVGPVELELIQAYDEEFASGVIDALLDVARYDAIVKKKANPTP